MKIIVNSKEVEIYTYEDKETIVDSNLSDTISPNCLMSFLCIGTEASIDLGELLVCGYLREDDLYDICKKIKNFGYLMSSRSDIRNDVHRYMRTCILHNGEKISPRDFAVVLNNTGVLRQLEDFLIDEIWYNKADELTMDIHDSNRKFSIRKDSRVVRNSKVFSKKN